MTLIQQVMMATTVSIYLLLYYHLFLNQRLQVPYHPHQNLKMRVALTKSYVHHRRLDLSYLLIGEGGRHCIPFVQGLEPIVDL